MGGIFRGCDDAMMHRKVYMCICTILMGDWCEMMLGCMCDGSCMHACMVTYVLL